MTEVERLRDALADAVVGMHDMIDYVPDYFREKWDHDGYINRATQALMKTPGGLDAIRKAGWEQAESCTEQPTEPEAGGPGRPHPDRGYSGGDGGGN